MTTKTTSHTRRQFQLLAARYRLPSEAADQMMAVHQGHLDRLRGRRDATIAHWGERVRQDPEIGRNNLPRALAGAREAVTRFGGDTLRRVFDDTGLGSHPEIVRAFARIGKATKDQPMPEPKRKPTHEETMRAMYPSMYGPKI